MPKTVWYVLALAALCGAAACSNNGTVTAPTPTPLPTATAATVSATYQATPLPSLVVNEYNSTISASATPAPNGTPVPLPEPTGPVIDTQTTDSTGVATFTNLTPGTTYCWTYVYTPPGSTAIVHAQSCTNAWYDGVYLGN